MLTIKQAAKYLTIVEPVLRLAIRGGKISARRVQSRPKLAVRRPLRSSISRKGRA